MKKTVWLTLVLFFTVIGATKAQKFDLGIKGGYLYSDMNVKNIDGVKSKSKGGYLLGAFARIGGNKWFFQPELQYRVRTADFKFVDAIKDNVEIKYKTLDVPLQLGVNLLNLSVAKIAVHAGPVASFKLDESTNIKDTASSLDKYFDDYKSVVWGGQVGVSVDVLRFVIDLSYEKGFSDLSEKGVGKNDLFMATLGIKFL